MKINLKITTALGTFGLCVLAATPQTAHAQTTGIIPLRIKVGALLPSQSATRDASGSVVPQAELDIHIPRILGADYASIGIQNRSHNGGKLQVVPVTLSRTFQPGNPLGMITGSPYFGVGLGAYYLDGHANGDSKSKIAPGGFGQVGYQFPNKYFIEAKYQIVGGKVAGLRPDGLLLSVGRAF